MNELRRLLVEEGLTYNDVIQRLKLSERTFYRLLNAVFADDRRLLFENVSDDEVLNQMAICRDRLLKQRRDILEQIANNPKADDKARVAAHHLAAEIAAVAFKVYKEGPGILVARHKFPRTSLTGPGTTGVKLELKKKGKQLPPTPIPYSAKECEKEEKYDELDLEQEEEEDQKSYSIQKAERQI